MSRSIEALSNQLADRVAGFESSLVAIRSGRRRATGVAWSEDGLVVTVNRALGRSGAAEVIVGSESFAAELIGRDHRTDLALLRIDRALTVPAWSKGDEIRVGQLVLTLGRPGASVRATLGLIEGLGPAWRSHWGGSIDRAIDVDGRLPPGFSGGVLVDLSGRVLGVNTRGLLRGGATLPRATVERVIARLDVGGQGRPGYLGIVVQAVALPAELAERYEQSAGLMVASVEAGGPADHAELRFGDVLLRLDGASLETADDLLAALGGKTGAQAQVTLLRGGETLERTVDVAARGAD